MRRGLCALCFLRAACSLTTLRAWEPPRREARLVDASWVIDSWLVAAPPRIVANLSSHSVHSRYWNIVVDDGVRGGGSVVHLVARNGANRGAEVRAFNEAFANCTALLRRVDSDSPCVADENRVSLPKGPHSANAARNLAVWRSAGGGVMGLGGESSELLGAVPVARREQRYEVPPKDGAAAMWAPSVSALLEAGWSRLRRSALRGDAPGCVERFTRLSPTGTCTFDAKFSVTPLAERSLVYARANLNASGGGRFVQLTSSLARDLEAGARSAGAAIVWRPFELVSFASSGESGARARPPTLSRECRAHRGAFRHYAAEVAAAGDIYLFAVNPNPALPTTLLALFTVVLGGCAVVALSASRDGARFSAPWPVVRSETFFGGRSFDHPVDGFVRDGDKVHFYVHANVQGITSTPRRGFPPHLARYTMRLDRLARWTLDALETLR